MRTLRAFLGTALLIHAVSAQAGNGTIDFASGTVNLTMNLRFPATVPQMTILQDRVIDMSHVLWDAPKVSCA